MIKTQIDELKKIFNNKHIYDETSKHILTDAEHDSIQSFIHNNKNDGVFEISEDIKIEFKKGKVYLTDILDE